MRICGRFALLLVSVSFVTADTKGEALSLLRHDELQSMDAAVRLGVHEKRFPGGVLWFQHRDNVYHKAFGNRSVDPGNSP